MCCGEVTVVQLCSEHVLYVCASCPCVNQGYYCSAGATTYYGCPGGYYCPASSATYYSCAAGWYSSSYASACTGCPAGKYQNIAAKASCNTCPGGYYCPTVKMTGYSTCPAVREHSELMISIYYIHSVSPPSSVLRF